jgi:hypothetical protein
MYGEQMSEDGKIRLKYSEMNSGTTDKDVKNNDDGFDKLSLETQIKVLKAAFDIFAERNYEYKMATSERIENLFKLHDLCLKRFEIIERSFNKTTKTHADFINDLMLGMQQMQEAYYEVFPDRLAQDNRVLHQLKALRIEPSSDADPDKA